MIHWNVNKLGKFTLEKFRSNCAQCHHNCGIVQRSFTNMFEHCRKLEKEHTKHPPANTTSVTWLAIEHIKSTCGQVEKTQQRLTAERLLECMM